MIMAVSASRLRRSLTQFSDRFSQAGGLFGWGSILSIVSGLAVLYMRIPVLDSFIGASQESFELMKEQFGVCLS